ncbi:MAG: hypothetical protein WAP03_29895 [Methylorubrum rhodinum]|uniref:hypothetical protein n=1 Tax=Methylorubrum rhodinum TaxID=29428 RepID=UPI003BAE4CFB
MGEYVMTTVTIGGTVPHDVIETGLVEAVAEHFRTLEDFSDLGELIEEALLEGTSVTFQGECNCGKTDSLDAYCRRHGLSYQRAWTSALGQFEAGLEYWRPGMNQPAEEAADEGGEPVITLRELRAFQRKRGTTLAKLVARMSRASALAVPPLTIAPSTGSDLA